MDDLIGKQFEYVKTRGQRILLTNGTVLDTVGTTYETDQEGIRRVTAYTLENGTVIRQEDVCYLWFSNENPIYDMNIFIGLFGEAMGSVMYHRYIVREECKAMEKESK